MNIDALFLSLWEKYRSINPQASRIHALLSDRGEQVINDHVAFRTFNHPAIHVQKMAESFIREGYSLRGEYAFPEKQLHAIHLEHPDRRQPKVFLSEYLIEKLPASLQSLVYSLINQISPLELTSQWLCSMGRPWKLTKAEYESLGNVSEYAAWLAAFGFQANHFTVLFNSLRSFSSLQDLNLFLKGAGFRLNQDGGEIKGSPKVFLEQSSTLAAKVQVEFSDGPLEIPACYYEFALRYNLPNGELFQGFVAGNAARIFTSTDRQAA